MAASVLTEVRQKSSSSTPMYVGSDDYISGLQSIDIDTG